eukprot:4601295-Pyramimonas_sp.AAC.1
MAFFRLKEVGDSNVERGAAFDATRGAEAKANVSPLRPVQPQAEPDTEVPWTECRKHVPELPGH